MSEHRIVVPPSKEPKPVTARCECGSWERPFRSTLQRLATIDEARQHLSGGPEGAVWMLALDDGGTLLQDHAPQE